MATDQSVVEEPEFWLPSEFLTEEDILMDTNFSFPTEFPYDFDALHVNSSHQEGQLTELTRQLKIQNSRNPVAVEKSRWVMAGSPQSTLMGSWSGQSPGSSNGGSPNGPSQVSSPPITPLGVNNDAFDLIHQAAGQVAKLKINGGGHLGLDHTNAFFNNYGLQMLEEQKLKQQQLEQRYGLWSNRQVRNGWTPQQQYMTRNRDILFGLSREDEQFAALSSLQYMQHQNRSVSSGAVFNGGRSGNVGGVKRQCAGTGVFLPRSYGTESRKKPGCSTAFVPAGVVQSADRSFGNVNRGLIQPQPQAQAHFGGGYNAEYLMLETLLARRNAMNQQKMRNLRAINHELSLPQEWTY